MVARWLALCLVVACGAEPKQPVLANVPRADPAAVAGTAAAAAAAMTLVDPNAATRGKPEKSAKPEDKAPVEVKENVPSDVLDRLDDKHAGSGSAAPAADAAAKPAKPAAKHKGPPPKIPSPEDAAKTIDQP